MYVIVFKTASFTFEKIEKCWTFFQKQLSACKKNTHNFSQVDRGVKQQQQTQPANERKEQVYIRKPLFIACATKI